MQEYIKQTRKHGLAINTFVVIAAAFRIAMSHDANQLAENGGGIKLTDAWAKNLLKHLDMSNIRFAVGLQELCRNNFGNFEAI